MAFNKSVKNIIGGISQEPFNIRDDSNVEFQLNCLGSFVSGLSRRSGNYHVSDITLTSNDLLNVNKIKHKDGFLIVDANKGIYFVKKDGTKYLTLFENTETQTNFNNYLSGTTDLGFLNLNDLSYIFNRNKKVSLKEIQGGTYEFIDGSKKSIIYLNNIEKTKKYSIDIDYSFVGDNINIPVSWIYALGNGTTLNTDLSNSQNIKGHVEYIVDQDNMTNESFFLNLFSKYRKYESKDTYSKKSVITNSNIPSVGYGGKYDNLSIIFFNTLSSSNTITVYGEYYDEEDGVFVEGSEQVTFSSGTGGNNNFGQKKFRQIYEVYTSNVNECNFVISHRTDNAALMALKAGFKNNFIHIKPTFNKNLLILEGYKPKYYNGNYEVKFNSVVITDERNNINMFKVTNEKNTSIEDFNSLPTYFLPNSVIPVILNGKNTFFVFKPNSDTYTIGEPTNGVWTEYKDPNSKILDYSTTPFSIIIDDYNEKITIFDGGFKNREVGDSESNKDPYFVNRNIKDMFIYGGRLTILSGGDKIDFSGTNDFYNFYRTTTLTNLESDRISISITSDKLINITKAIPFNQSVLLLDDDTQFIMSYQGGLSINTLQTQEISNFNTKSGLKPIRTNDSLFFISDYGNNTQVTKFNAKDIQLVQGLDVTKTVQSLIPDNITSSCVNGSNDILFLHNKNSNKYFSYQYKMLNNEDIFGSWGVHDFYGYNIRFIDCIDDELFLFCNDNIETNKIKLFKQNLSKDITYENNFDNEIFKIHLDKKKVYNIKDNPENIDLSNNQKQYLTINYDIHYDNLNIEKLAVISTGYNNCEFKYGYYFNIVDITKDLYGKTKIVIENPFFEKSINNSNYLIDEVLVGEEFDSYVDLSKVNLVNRNGVPMNNGYTQLLSLTINFGETAGFKVGTDIINSGYYEEVFSGKYTGSPNTVVGEVSLQSGSNNFYLGAEKNEIKTNIINLSYFPFHIHSIEYEIEYDSNVGGF